MCYISLGIAYMFHTFSNGEFILYENIKNEIPIQPFSKDPSGPGKRLAIQVKLNSWIVVTGLDFLFFVHHPGYCPLTRN